MQSKTFIELFVPDLQRTIDWYQKIGFKVFSHPEPDYAILELEGNQIKIYGNIEIIRKHSWFGKFPSSTPVGYLTQIDVIVGNIDEIYMKVLENCKENIVQELKMKPWNVRDFRIHDLWGFYLRFTEPID